VTTELGWFDQAEDVFVHPHGHGTFRGAAATAAHEVAHRDLALTTTFGSALRFMQYAEDRFPPTAIPDPGRLGFLLDTANEACETTQEGYATYREFLYHELKESRLDQRTPLPKPYRLAVDRFLVAGRTLPAEISWTEPLCLTAMAAVAMNTLILATSPTTWLDGFAANLTSDVHRPDARLLWLSDELVSNGWPAPFVSWVARHVPEVLDPRERTQAELLRLLSTTKGALAVNDVQDELNLAFARAACRAIPGLAEGTELHAKDKVISWWTEAVAAMRRQGVVLPGMSRDTSWLSLLKAGEVTYLPRSPILDREVDVTVARAVWLGAPEGVHVHMHLADRLAYLFLLGRTDPSESPSYWQLLDDRGVCADPVQAARFVADGATRDRSISVTLGSPDTGSRHLLALLERTPGVVIDEGTDPSVTLALLRQMAGSADSITLARTENPDLAWYFGEFCYESEPVSWTLCRSFPGLVGALQENEPELAESLFESADSLPQTPVRHRDQLCALLITIICLGGLVPPKSA
jgi:hypothetical protein